MQLHTTQKIVARDNHRFRVLRCGRRWGKNVLAIEEMLGKALSKPNVLIHYIAPTFQQARDITWERLKERCAPALSKPPNESRLELSLRTQHGGTSQIFLRGWESVETLRGQLSDFLVPDEIRDMRGWHIKWQQILRPMLTDRRGEGLFLSTPRGYDQFYDLCNLELKDTDYKTYHFTTYDNPHIPVDEIEKAKLELTEESFEQEYLAEFRKFTGLIYKEFDRAVHAIEPFDIDPRWRIYRVMDFGGVNPTVCLWLAVDDDNTIYVIDEYYQSQKTIEFHAGVIQAKTGKKNVITTFGDPSGVQQMLDYGNYGIPIAPAIKNTGHGEDWVISGITNVQRLLKPIQGKPKLYVFRTCQNTIKEFENYHWLEIKGTEQLKDRPDKVDDHCLDALRYGIVSIFPQQQEKEPEYLEWMAEKRQQDYNPYTGY